MTGGQFDPMMTGIYEMLAQEWGISVSEAEQIVKALTSDDVQEAMRKAMKKRPQREEI